MVGTRKFFPWGVGNPTFYLTLLAGAATLGTLVTAVWSKSWETAVTTGIASFMSGGIFGFVFGIPRYAASAADKQNQLQVKPEAVKYVGNTNLEQISDWVTKILVGIGLTQFTAIGRWFQRVTNSVGHSLVQSKTVSGSVEAGALILLTAICGFIYFYLASRVYLPRMLQLAESE